jgi:hypothetical protein
MFILFLGCIGLTVIFKSLFVEGHDRCLDGTVKRLEGA